MQFFSHTEKHLSQIPALQLLANLGYIILSQQDTQRLRGNNTNNVLLEGILYEQLQKINRIRTQGDNHLFSEANVQEAIQRIKNTDRGNYYKTNERVYDMLTLGIALEQTINGDRKSHTLNYIDWQNPQNNTFHAAPEYEVQRTRTISTARPDIVLFVNGIPFAVIECKKPAEDVQQAISQNIRNQGDDYIPHLFATVQLIIATNKNTALYATTGSKKEHWGRWREQENIENNEDEVRQAANKTLTDEQKNALFAGGFRCDRDCFDQAEKQPREITEQDRAIYNLCRPQRLLELAWRYIVYDNGIKKIAYYQQFFSVRAVLHRIKQRNNDGRRRGGIVWQTQGAGKSLTMVMLARALALDTEVVNPRIVLVTDREDLDRQLANTFTACGLSNARAQSGRDLMRHLKDKTGIVTTLIHKFARGWGAKNEQDDSPDVFVLADESHRTQYGNMAALMRRILPNACYIGFTGTPLTKNEKNTFTRFDGLIKPQYSVRQALEDKVIVPLLYERRLVEMTQSDGIDVWFKRHTRGLGERQKADLKKKYARARMLDKAQQVVYARAYDISEHYRKNWQDTGFKAQLVAPDKITAILYHDMLNEIGTVSSAVVISPPDVREGHDEVNRKPEDAVSQFWQRMMRHYGNKTNYEKNIISRFKSNGAPEIIIVVDKLLTGFDAPRNTVLYLCRRLREHTLLQAIARVNRLHEGKKFGYIVDYVSILQELDAALTQYDALAGYDDEDLAGVLIAVDEQLRKLPHTHDALRRFFHGVANKNDEEQFEQFLAPNNVREEFYDKLKTYSRCLAIALSTEKFLTTTDDKQINDYKADLKRYYSLRKSVAERYADTVNDDKDEPKIKKLLDTHIQAHEFYQINPPLNVFDKDAMRRVMEETAAYKNKRAAVADKIAHNMKKIAHERMGEDPAYYEAFSTMLQKAIDDYKAGRFSGLEYLNKTEELRRKMTSNEREDIPAEFRHDSLAAAYYGIFRSTLGDVAKEKTDNVVLKVATRAMCRITAASNNITDFWSNSEATNKVKNDMDDFFYDTLGKQHRITLKDTQMDGIVKEILRVAKNRAQR